MSTPHDLSIHFVRSLVIEPVVVFPESANCKKFYSRTIVVTDEDGGVLQLKLTADTVFALDTNFETETATA